MTKLFKKNKVANFKASGERVNNGIIKKIPELAQIAGCRPVTTKLLNNRGVKYNPSYNPNTITIPTFKDNYFLS